MNQASGNPDPNNETIVSFLNLLLANEYVLYSKTRTAHWNLDGSNYFELHVFLENQYNTLDDMIDDIAEQIRSLGHYALGSLKDFLSISKMSEDNHNYNNSHQIVETLLSDHETIIKIIHDEVFPVSNKFKDRDTSDFVTGLLEQHIKMVQMIRLFLSKPHFMKPTPIHNYRNLFFNRSN
jgi:starvation-inducible DNA-binding protein